MTLEHMDVKYGCTRGLWILDNEQNRVLVAQASPSVQCSRQQTYDPIITEKRSHVTRRKVHLSDMTAVYAALAGALPFGKACDIGVRPHTLWESPFPYNKMQLIFLTWSVMLHTLEPTLTCSKLPCLGNGVLVVPDHYILWKLLRNKI